MQLSIWIKHQLSFHYTYNSFRKTLFTFMAVYWWYVAAICSYWLVETPFAPRIDPNAIVSLLMSLSITSCRESPLMRYVWMCNCAKYICVCYQCWNTGENLCIALNRILRMFCYLVRSAFFFQILNTPQNIIQLFSCLFILFASLRL